MATDYAKISTSSREKYGTDISNYGPALLANLYSKRTHFVFELLQNAEDAHASFIDFRLYRDRLEVRHNGKVFDERDVLSICSIARSSKREDLTQIGKFGIGFKAVYAYTHSPTIYSGPEAFVIENFVHPRAAPPIQRESNQTLFVFPFDHPEISAKKAFDEIESELRRFELQSLLFLRHLARMNVSIDTDYQSAMAREIGPANEPIPNDFRHIILHATKAQNGISENSREEWLLLEAAGRIAEKPFRVSVAFRLLREGSAVAITRCVNPPVYVYFPTEKFCPTGFLIQGPFRTTPSRDNIPGEDDWNISLAKEVSKLARAAFLIFAKSRMLDIKTLECLPLSWNPYPLYELIYQELLEMVRTEAVIPVDGGGYALARQCLVPRGEELRKLFSTKGLRNLTTRTDVYWTAHGITSDYQLATYWKENHILKVVEPHDLLAQLRQSFLMQQSDAWMKQFYHFLAEHRSLLKSTIKDKPIVRTETNEHVVATNVLNQPLVYLPGETPTDFPTLKACFASDPRIKTFFQQLGLREPRIDDILKRHVLPQYQKSPVTVSLKDNLIHLKAILSAGDKDPKIIDLVSKHPIIRCEPGFESATKGPGNVLWEVPSKTYIRSKALDAFFGDWRGYMCVSSEYSKQDAAALAVLGCSTEVRVFVRPPGCQNYVKIRSEHSNHERGVDGFDPKFRIDGLEYVLENPNIHRAQVLWNDLLLKFAHCIEGVVERSSQSQFPAARVERQHLTSDAGKLLLTAAWLPDKSGKLHVPSELTLDDLPDNFVRSELLAQKLKLKVSMVATLAKEQGVDPSILDFAVKYPHLVEELRKKMAKDLLDASSKPKLEKAYAEELAERLREGDVTVLPEIPAAPSSGLVKNPEQRRERLTEELRESKASEPAPNERFSRVATRVYEGADEVVREELRVWYQGRCQICEDTFLKRDGSYYFEAVHLVPSSDARWLNTVGNVVCLCANCSARFQHGPRQSDDLIDQIRSFRTASEGGGPAHLQVVLCGEAKQIHYNEKHLLALQVLVLDEGVAGVQ